jgi:hypothetical protein
MTSSCSTQSERCLEQPSTSQQYMNSALLYWFDALIWCRGVTSKNACFQTERALHRSAFGDSPVLRTWPAESLNDLIG